MKTGKSLAEMATEIERQLETKKDYIAPATKLEMQVVQKEDKQDVVLSVPVNGHSEGLPIRKLAHQQLSTITEIPFNYYEKMKESHPRLLSTNVNHWLMREPKNKMVRTLDGQVRALLSDRYNRIDNYDTMQVILPEIMNMKDSLDLRIVSCDITDNKIYLKVTTPKIAGEVTVGDVVQSGFLVSNSEVGQGSIVVAPFITRLSCTNGMTVDDASQKRRHVGRQVQQEDMDLYSDETKRIDLTAFFLKVRDTVRATLEQSKFEKILNKFREAKQIPVHNPEAVVELAANRLNLTEGEGKQVFQHLLRGNDMSLWGLANAITRTAEDAESYDRASELELIGSKALLLEPKLVSAKAA